MKMNIANTFGDPQLIAKLVLLTDASSNVPSFESYGEDFVRELTAQGMQTATSVDLLAA